MSAKNIIAVIFIIFSLLLGATSIACAGTVYKTFGLILLIISVLLNVSAIILSLLEMRETVREEKTDKEILKRMIDSGTLSQYLKDINQE